LKELADLVIITKIFRNFLVGVDGFWHYINKKSSLKKISDFYDLVRNGKTRWSLVYQCYGFHPAARQTLCNNWVSGFPVSGHVYRSDFLPPISPVNIETRGLLYRG